MIIECPECGAKNSIDKPSQLGKRYRCGKCGASITFPQTIDTPSENTSAAGNTSGQGKLAIIPNEIRGWNWGAFVFGWIWGISFKVWISLLSAIPYIGVIMLVVLGVKGNEWAWQNKKWDSIEHFKRTQRKWAWWGLGVSVVGLVIGILSALAS